MILYGDFSLKCFLHLFAHFHKTLYLLDNYYYAKVLSNTEN